MLVYAACFLLPLSKQVNKQGIPNFTWHLNLNSDGYVHYCSEYQVLEMAGGKRDVALKSCLQASQRLGLI